MSLRIPRRWLRRIALAALPVLLSSCSALHPKDVSLEERLAMFPAAPMPLDHAVTVRWNEHGVPWIEAKTDHDLAFALGLVHAHLRLGQIALMRRVAQGRLSESGGPFGQDIDHVLRTIDFGYAAADIEAKLPPDTKAWLNAFVDGLNWYQDHAKDVPPEYGLLAMKNERWTVRDLIAIGRLAGTDVNWLSYSTLLRARLAPDWPETWRRALAAGTDSAPSFGHSDEALLRQLLQGGSRSGSNALAVSPTHSATGAALLAGDPHLGLTLPNFWLLVGVKSPSYHAVGFMVPGLPILGLGRNDDIAWSGTNMRAAQSELIDVTGEPDISERREHIATRLWFDKDVTIRRAKEGPILSDLPMFPAKPGETIALKWVGHQVSDEFSAFLAVMRAKSADEFRQAFASYGVGGQNMICATKSGDICQVIAAHMPVRDNALPSDLVRRADDPAAAWHGVANATTLPFALNPAKGVLASANNRATESPFPLGFLYPPSERVERLYALLQAKDKIGLDDLTRLQQDTLSTAALSLKERLLPLVRPSTAAPELVATIAAWDGRYDADKAGPVAFEALLYEVTLRLYGDGKAVPGTKSDWSYLVHFLPQDLAAAPDRQKLIDASLAAAAETAKKFPTWGDMHRVGVSHMLAQLPLIGGSFSLGDYGAGGSRNTVMKTAHGLVHDRHVSTYGSQARQICDLSNPDGCRFVLFGGEDGWLGSANFADQMPLWREGRTISMPLSETRVAAEFPRAMMLEPQR
jgi:penicillin amidase